MAERIKHYFRSRRTCRGFCLFCRHHKICMEDMNYEQLGRLSLIHI